MISLHINCLAESGGTIPTANGYLLLSALSKIITKNAGLNLFHDLVNKRKDFTLSPLLPARHWKGRLAYPSAEKFNTVKGDEYAFRICFLDNKKAEIFKEYVFREHFHLGPVDFTACKESNSQLFCRQDEESSLVALPPADGSEFLFFTPTGIKSAKSGTSLLLPRPEEIFSNLAQSWKDQFCNTLAEELDCGTINILEFSLKSRYVRLKDNTPLRGCTGSVRYSWKKLPRNQRAALTALAIFAFYTGVGYKTTQGLGQVIPKLHYSKI